MKKALPLTLVLIGAALLITAVVFWIDSSASTEPQSFGKTLLDWVTLIAGLGVSIKGWMDLFKKEKTLIASQENRNGGIIISGKVDSVGKDVVGRDQNITTNIVSEETAYNVEGLPNPYLGLQAFTYSERERYAGREKLAKEALQRLVTSDQHSNLLFITGASGSGKSSFAQAGLLPAIISYYEQKGFRVHHSVIRPSRHPKTRLNDAILQLAPDEIQVIIIDQFEELFTQSIPSQRDEIVDFLNTLTPFSQSHRFFIATLRSDYLGDLHDSMESLWEIAKNGISLRAMKQQEIKDAIQRPLQVRFPNGSKRFEKELVEKLAEDTTEITYLPLLQVTLEALWHKGELKLSRYSSLTDAIKERADTVWTYHDFDSATPVQNRSKEEQSEIVKLLLDLVNVSMDDDSKRDVRINRLTDDFSDKERELLYDLSRARLVSISMEDGREFVSLIHETLIRSWDVLRDNIAAMRLQLQKRARFETQLRLWLSSNRSDDYLLNRGQVTEARELEQSEDIALNRADAKDFLRISQENLDKDRQLARDRQQDLVKLSHLLQSPLHASIGRISLILEDDKLSQSLRKRLEFCNSLLLDAQDQIYGILLTTGLESGQRIYVSKDKVSARETTRAIYERLRSTGNRPDLKFEYVEAEDFPPVTIDRRLFSSVLYTLMRNATQYADQGSIVRLECGFEWILPNRTAKYPAIKVKSLGPPILFSEREKVFEKFYRGQSVRTTARYGQGIGWGLWVARSIMRESGGDLSLEVSKDNDRLSVFIIHFPSE